MADTQPRFIGVELYFDNLSAATNFYSKTLGLAVADEEAGHYAKFSSGAGFVCLEKKGVESYPSRDKAVLFFEVPDLQAAIAAIGKDRIVQVRIRVGRPSRSRGPQYSLAREIAPRRPLMNSRSRAHASSRRPSLQPYFLGLISSENSDRPSLRASASYAARCAR